jgi:hypothetical protein
MIILLRVFAITVMTCITTHYAYSYFDVDLNGAQNAYNVARDNYNREHRGDWEPPFPSFEEWERKIDERSYQFWEDFGYGCAAAFDPSFVDNRSEGYDPD